MKLTKQTEAALLKAYYDFWESNLSADMEKFSSYLVDDFSIFGSANGEVFFSRQDAVRFYTATADEMRGKAELRNRNVSVQPLDTNSVIVREESDLYVRMGNEWTFYGHARISCIVKHIDGGWKALHQHASFPDHRTEPGQQLASEKIEKENLELREAVKRRTAELESKNRELEIEAALERVRTVAMGMKKPEDMLNICRIISQQLEFLNVKHIRNVQTAIISESKGTYCNYEYYVKHDKLLITDVDYNLHAEHAAFVNKMLESPEAFYSQSFVGEELKDWYAYQKTTSQFADAYLEQAASLNYYMYSVGGVVLGMSTYEPLNEAEINLFKRFRNVFDLAYRRFVDIEKAESQAREAQIEAAVEKVRTQSLGMHRTSDLAKVNKELLDQLTLLKIDGLTGVAIYLVDTDDFVSVWDLSSPGNMSDPNSYSFRFDSKKFPVLSEFVGICKAGLQDYFVLDFPKERLETVRDELLQIHPPVGRQFKDALESGALTHQWNPAGRLSDGMLSIDVMVPPSDDTKSIVIKMAGAFNLAYQRFLDLQKAEEQAKESQVQLALERVRARTMAMQRSDELADASFVLDSQVRALGIKTHGCAFNIYDDHDSEEWFSSEMGAMPRYRTPRENLFLRYYEVGKTGTQIHIEEFAGDACKAHYEYLCTIPGIGDGLREMIRDGGSFPTRQIDHAVYFKYGYLLFITLEPVPEAHAIFIRFAKVFEQTYTRFLDLQKAEAQALRAGQDIIEIKSARKKAEDALTELQLTQKQLIQSEKMASLGELTAGIAHEIQNPLNFVNNFSEVSKELLEELQAAMAKGHVTEAQEIIRDVVQNLEKINHHGKRADGIVKGMLQHSRTGTGQKELTDINALCDEYLRLAYHGLKAKDKAFNARFETAFDTNLPRVNVVPQEVGRVILNLINNAFYAVSERQKVQSGIYEPTVTITTKAHTDQLSISVYDNGNGIPQKVLDKIFQPFFTTKPTGQGTGLGLSLSYDIVKAHGGTLQVETKEGAGTEFSIVLPVSG